MALPMNAPLSAGSIAPDFTLLEVVSGQSVSFSVLLGPWAVLDFWSVDCPWSRHYDDYFLERTELWAEHGVTLVMIACNAGETIEQIRDMADAYGITNPILFDDGGAVADAYGAQTTPHVFLLDGTGRVIYQGAVDDRSFRQPEPTVNYLDAAVEALISGPAPAKSDTPAYGCQIVRQGL
jgi:peroxiredoxin